MRLAFFSAILCMLCGCMPNDCLTTAAAADTNVTNLSRLEKGMTQAQVLKIMRHPYRDEVFVHDNDTFDVWFYVTGRTVLGQSRMVPQNLTPLTFKNGKLIGWGSLYYNYLKAWQKEIEREKLAPMPESLQIAPAASSQGQSAPNSGASQQEGQGQKKGEETKPAGPGQPNWGPIAPPSAPSSQPKKGAQGSQPPGQSGSQPNWGPIEKNPQPAPPPSPSQTSMSQAPQKNQNGSQNGTKQQQDEEKKSIPLTEEDEDALQEERMQNFDQT